jgi:hypothetical protein
MAQKKRQGPEVPPPTPARGAPERLVQEVAYRERFTETVPLREMAMRLLKARRGLNLGADVTFLDLPGVPNITDEEVLDIVTDQLKVGTDELGNTDVLARINRALLERTNTSLATRNLVYIWYQVPS